MDKSLKKKYNKEFGGVWKVSEYNHTDAWITCVDSFLQWYLEISAD